MAIFFTPNAKPLPIITADQIQTWPGLARTIRDVREHVRTLRTDAARQWRMTVPMIFQTDQRAIPEPVGLEVIDTTPEPDRFGERFTLTYEGYVLSEWHFLEGRDNVSIAAQLNAISASERIAPRLAFRQMSPAELTTAEREQLRRTEHAPAN